MMNTGVSWGIAAWPLRLQKVYNSYEPGDRDRVWGVDRKG